MPNGLRSGARATAPAGGVRNIMLAGTLLCGLALLAGAGEPHDTVESVALALFEGALPPPPPPPPPPDMNHTPSGELLVARPRLENKL